MLPGKKYTPEDILRILWLRKWLILVPFVLIPFGTGVVAWRLPNRFKAETLIVVVPQRVPDAYVRSTVISTERSLQDRLETIKQPILSRTRLERLILDLNLYPNERKIGLVEDVVQKMRSDIEIQVVPRGDAFRVGFIYEDRRLAVDVVNKLASAFIDESNQDRTLFAESTTNFLQTQLDEARRTLEDLEKKLADYRLKHMGELPTERESNLQVLANTQMQVQQVLDSMMRDRDRRYFLERTLSDLSADAQANAPTVPTTAEPNAISGRSVAEQLESARTALRGLERRLKPDHPDVKAMKRAIADLEQKAQQEAIQNPVSPEATPQRSLSPVEEQRQARIRELRLEMEGIDRTLANRQAEEKTLRAQIAEYQRRVEAAPVRESELTSLLRDYDTVQKHYAGLLSRQEDAKIAANLERRQIGEQFRTVDQARLPEKPVSPNRPFLIMVGALAGLGLGLSWIALLEFRDNSFRTDEEIVRLLALPVVAMIPAMWTAREREARRRRTILVSVATSAALIIGIAAVSWIFLLRQ